MSGKLAVILFLLLRILTVSAQDRIIQSDRDTIRCFIREIGDDEVKYSMEGYRSDLIFGIDKDKVSEIIFADGKSNRQGVEYYPPVGTCDQADYIAIPIRI